jgi:hypothetical protein
MDETVMPDYAGAMLSVLADRLRSRARAARRFAPLPHDSLAAIRFKPQCNSMQARTLY